MNKTTVEIKGMHCNSCEILIEDELLQVPGVTAAKVNQKKGCAVIYHDQPVSISSISDAVVDAGYSLGKDVRPVLSKNSDDYMQVLIIAMILFVVWFFGNTFGFFSSFKLPELNNYGSLPIVFLIGLTAGISTCMALIGGLVLGSAARFAEKHPTATTMQKFTPHLYFNLGRIVSFLIFGALIGYIGSFFKFSSGTLGFLIIAVSGVMFLLGAQLTELSPKLSAVKLTLPSNIAKALGIREKNEKEYSHTNAIVLGALTFFLPCGFTQAMQLYAMSTGNPVIASLTMGVFALGTAPGLLGIGGVTSLVKGAFATWFYKFSGVVVIGLALFNLQSGITMSGIKNFSIPSLNSNVLSATSGSANAGELQRLKATYSVATDMQPNNFTVKAGSPVRLEVTAQENGAGCMGSIALPGLSDKVAVFQKGKTEVYEFTPSQKGDFTIACAMGVPRGTIKVI